MACCFGSWEGEGFYGCGFGSFVIAVTTTALASTALVDRLHGELPADLIYSGVVHLFAVLAIAVVVATVEQMSQATALHVQKRDQGAQQERNAHCATDEQGACLAV
uniref:Uncharacterized protein n=1 Tax=Bactrocera dorsalis TaxID=27457 RepID=A0A034VNB4_BACDO